MFSGGELQVGFQDVVFLPSAARFQTIFLRSYSSAIEASELSHVLVVWLGLSKGTLGVDCLHSDKSSFGSVEFHGDCNGVTRITTLVSVYLCWCVLDDRF